MGKLSRDPYITLGVPHSATAREIKKAYRKLARQHHPDKNPGDATAAAERFKEIGAAYAVLGDPMKRAECDMARIINARPKRRARPRSPFHTKPRHAPTAPKPARPSRARRHSRTVTFDDFFGGLVSRVSNVGVGVDLDEPAPPDLVDDSGDDEFDVEDGGGDAAEDYAAEGGDVNVEDGGGRRRRGR